MYAYAVGHAIDEQWALGAKNATVERQSEGRMPQELVLTKKW